MVLGADKEKPLIVGIVVERVIKRTSVGRRNWIQTKPNQTVPMEKDDNDHTMSRV